MNHDSQKQLAAVKRYQASPKGRATLRRYYDRPEVRAHRNKQNREWRTSHLEQAKKTYQKSNHKSHYGEPWENKAKRLAEQGGRCANLGCRTTDPGAKGWQTDHDHETGQVRGELCGGCNKALGFLHDNVSRLEGLIGYVRKYKCVI